MARDEMMTGAEEGRAKLLMGGPPAPLDTNQSYAVSHTSHIVDAIRDATHAGHALRITAGGGWLGAGPPTDARTRPLDLRALRGIIEYNPGDLTLTASAATTLAEIEEATRPHGQWLPLDPFGIESDTLGATLATASCGPLAASLGLPRDLALGVEFVDGRGTIVRGGGRVVKNVAGFDLVRLNVGAWGTLGVITEATVRLRARPERELSVALGVPDAPAALETLLRALRDLPLTPIAVELLSASLAARAGAGSGDTDVVLVRLAGNSSSLAAQRGQLAALDNDRDVPVTVWRALRTAFAPDAASFRLSRRPSELAALWTDLRTSSRELSGVLCHASLERGVARCVVPSSELRSLGALVGALVGALAARWHVVGEVLPVAAWSALAPVGADRLSTRVRAAFDPHSILNPGLMAPAR
jgi:glycolate oxidase FAD binding subunit